jgi:hypothetical protein
MERPRHVEHQRPRRPAGRRRRTHGHLRRVDDAEPRAHHPAGRRSGQRPRARRIHPRHGPRGRHGPQRPARPADLRLRRRHSRDVHFRRAGKRRRRARPRLRRHRAENRRERRPHHVDDHRHENPRRPVDRHRQRQCRRRFGRIRPGYHHRHRRPAAPPLPACEFGMESVGAPRSGSAGRHPEWAFNHTRATARA